MSVKDIREALAARNTITTDGALKMVLFRMLTDKELSRPIKNQYGPPYKIVHQESKNIDSSVTCVTPLPLSPCPMDGPSNAAGRVTAALPSALLAVKPCSYKDLQWEKRPSNASNGDTEAPSVTSPPKPSLLLDDGTFAASLGFDDMVTSKAVPAPITSHIFKEPGACIDMFGNLPDTIKRCAECGNLFDVTASSPHICPSEPVTTKSAPHPALPYQILVEQESKEHPEPSRPSWVSTASPEEFKR
jgi:hypothetical protein